MLIKLLDFIRSSIKRKMIMITVMIILFVVSTISFFTFRETSKTVKEDVQRYSTQILKQANLNLNRYFLEYEQGFLTIGMSNEFQDWLKIDMGNLGDMILEYSRLEEKYIRSFMLRHPEIISVSVLNSNGNEMHTTGALSFDMNYSFSNELHELEDMRLNETRISVAVPEYYRDTHGAVKNTIISLTRRFTGLRDYNKGYIRLDISLDPTEDILENIYLGDNGYVLLSDINGNVITGTGKGKAMEMLDDSIIEYTKAGASGAFYLAGIDDLVMYSIIPFTRWITIAVVPYEDVSGSIIHLRRITLVVTFVSLIAALFFVIVFASSVTGRLVKLRKSIKEVRKGNLDDVIEVNGIDEVADLSRVYNSMLTNLKNTIHDLAEVRVSQQEAVLSALQSQINSHFLYNTLESINSMANLANHKKIERVTIALSGMLRYTSDYKRSIVRIEDEIRHLVNYMDIIQIRYGDIITYDLDLDEKCMEVNSLKVIIQPLVENCIKHGIELTGKPVHISIKVGMTDLDYVFIRIVDNGKGFENEKLQQFQEKLATDELKEYGKFSNIGLLNVHHRLRAFYKDKNVGIHIENRNEDGQTGAIVEVVCPVQFRKSGGMK